MTKVSIVNCFLSLQAEFWFANMAVFQIASFEAVATALEAGASTPAK